eukprot:NODE_38_length_2589_cov_1490.948031_g15_i0.p1 GENE.NODE_38_length_2589_cov_1490.948031_g15_i0~~NODE_38_length_2589_cov_1490.948031_g15_i0.p1  ORF type:complete len:791 (-),score=301.44 NODE_38_length_2589_cov_1490.948031_g15_i0:216-2558(-)
MGKSVVVLGDDTWLSLYNRSSFLRADAYPSFDVRDLHSVDNGVLSTLYEEVPRRDHQLLIAHFLGVDHAGHRYSPDHPQMAAKLQQMDAMLRNVSSLMSEEDMLIVMGDHGMSPGGDHGGGTDMEVSAALYVWQKKPTTRLHKDLWNTLTDLKDPAAVYNLEGRQVPKVPQIDFVATLAVLLGLPIPYSNLGKVMPDVLVGLLAESTAELDGMRAVVAELRYNAWQVYTYLEAYQEVSHPFTDQHYRDAAGYFRSANAICDGLFGASTQPDYETATEMERHKLAFAKYYQFLTTVRSFTLQMWTAFDVPVMAMGLTMVALSTGCALLLLLDDWRQTKWPPVISAIAVFTIITPAAVILGATWVALGMCVCCTAALSSHARGRQKWRASLWELVQHPLNVVSVVAHTLHCVSMLSNSYIVLEDRCVQFWMVTFACAAALAALGNCDGGRQRLTCAAVFGVCVGCIRGAAASTIHRTLGTHLIDKSLAVVLMPWPVTIGLVYCGCVAVSNRLPVGRFTQWYVHVSALCCVGYWAVRHLDEGDEQPFAAIVCARGVYGTFIVHHLIVTYGARGGWWRSLPECLVGVCMLALFLTGESYAHVFMLTGVATGCLSWLVRTAHRSSGALQNAYPAIAYTTFLGAQHLFFCTGHQRVFNMIDFNSGFIGLTDYSYVLSGLLVTLHTFLSYIIFTLATPLISRLFVPNDPSLDGRRRPSHLEAPVTPSVVTHQAFHLSLCLWASVCVFLHRRHLMVWAIFTPAYVFFTVQATLVTVLSIAVLCYTAMK